MENFNYRGFDVIVNISQFCTFDIYYNKNHYQYLIFDAEQRSDNKLINIVKNIIDTVWNLKTYDDVVDLLATKVNENTLPFETTKFIVQFFVEQILKK